MKQISKSEVFRLIEEGVTKNRKSPNYNPELGTLHEKLNLTQQAVKRLFDSNVDLQRAYMRKHKTTKASDFTLVDDLVGEPEVSPEVIEGFAEIEVEETPLNW